MNILRWRNAKQREGSQPGPDILTELKIELVDAFRGTTRTLEINRDEFCMNAVGRAGTL